MNWKGHIAATFIIYILLVLIFQFPLPNSIAALILLTLASILPDFDHPKSVIRETLSIFAGFFTLILFLMLFEIELVFRLIGGSLSGILVYALLKTMPLRHRGKRSLHQWSVCFLLAGICAVVFFFLGIAFEFLPFIFVGYAVHLLTDKNV